MIALCVLAVETLAPSIMTVKSVIRQLNTGLWQSFMHCAGEPIAFNQVRYKFLINALSSSTILSASLSLLTYTPF